MCVQRVVVAHRAGECGVVFQSGEVVLWVLRAEDEREEDKNNLEMDIPTGEEVLLDLRMVESDGGAWRPKMLFNPKEGACTAVALCDVGELPLSFHSMDHWLMMRYGAKGSWRSDMSDRST